jgi:DNA-binding response OmpR family regulator
MSRSPASAAPKVVLIAEDEEPIAQALAYLIEDAGYMPVVAVHGKAALEMALAQRPDLIITDLMMPQMSGKEFISALRAALDTATPPIILMTAAGRRYTDAAGANALLSKPFDLSDVETLLERYLGEPARG